MDAREIYSSHFSLCVIQCVVIPFIPDVSFVDVPAGVPQEEGHTGKTVSGTRSSKHIECAVWLWIDVG